jgi:hypothetical protein
MVAVVPKAYPVRVAGLRPSNHFSRRPARGWTRAARICLVLLACLAQLSMPAQHPHAPGFAAQSMVHGSAATSTGVTAANFAAGQSSVPCAVHGTRANPNGGDPPAPCHGNCPFCPCPCSHVYAAMGILPQETARAAYPPPLSVIAAPPALLGTLPRFAVFAGQPRAPPILV